MRRELFIVSLIAGIQLLGGCGSSNKNTGSHAFVVNSTAGTIDTYNIQGDGSLVASGSEFSVGANAQCMALVSAGSGAASTIKNFAYVVNKGQNTINIFNVDSNGVLTTSSVSSIQDNNYPTNLVTDSSGLFLYAANNVNPGISVYTINSTTGALSLSGTAPMSFAPTFLATSAGFMYAAVPTAGVIEAFSIDGSTGLLTELAPSLVPIVSAGISPSFLTVAGGYLLAADSGGNSIYIFQIQSGQGNLLSVAGSPFSVGLNPSAIAVVSTSEIFVANENSENIAALTLSSTGQLEPITGSPYSTKGQGPVALAISPGGNALYAADSASSNLDEFQITTLNNNLSLTALSGSPVTTGGGPVWITVK